MVFSCRTGVKEKIYLSVKVNPRARQRQVEKISPSEYKVSVTSSPSKGQANKEVIKTLATYFDIPPSRVKILRGERSRQKLILLEMDQRRDLGLKKKNNINKNALNRMSLRGTK